MDENLEKARRPLSADLYSTLTRLVTDSDHRFIASMGGGSIPGLAGNLAMAEIIEELDLKSHVEEIWGTSAGSIIGAGWASGATAAEIKQTVVGMQKKRAVDVTWGKLLRALVLKPFGARLPDGLVRGRVFEDAIRSGLRVENFEDTKTPFRCIACTDDGLATRKIFRKGPLLPAIFASMSLPGVIIPRLPSTGEPSRYYDGGLVEKTPLISPIAEHMQSGDSRKLVILATHFGSEAKKYTADGFLSRFVQSLYAMEDQLWAYQLGEVRARKNVIVLLLNPVLMDPALFDFSRTEENCLKARKNFRETLSNARIAELLGQM